MRKSEKRKTELKAKRELSLGTVCCNCGKDCGTGIEYHHIVPLWRGGADVESNLAPLCKECHSLCTWGHASRIAERTGRKRKVYDAGLVESVFRRYVNKELSEIGARKELGTGQHIKEMKIFKEWAEKNGIDVSQNYGQSGRWYKRA